MRTIIALFLFSFLAAPLAYAKTHKKTINVKATEEGFEPNAISVPPGTDLTLKITRTTEMTCATSILIPAKKIKKALPLNKTVAVHLGKLEKGKIAFMCGMKMMDSVIDVN